MFSIDCIIFTSRHVSNNMYFRGFHRYNCIEYVNNVFLINILVEKYLEKESGLHVSRLWHMYLYPNYLLLDHAHENLDNFLVYMQI